MSDSTHASLYQKLTKVVAEVEQVEKRGHNDHFNYDYATAEDILRAIREPLARENVALLCSLGSITERPYTTAGGKESVITTVHVEFVFVDGESAAMHKCEWAGQGDDPADKGLGKAYTNAVKTFLRQQFLLPQGDDPEADSSTDKRAADRKESGAARQSGGRPASDKQKQFLQRLMGEREHTLAVDFASLSSKAASVLIDQLQQAPAWAEKPIPPSDVPNDFPPARSDEEVLAELQATFGEQAA